MKKEFYEGELWINELEAIAMPMLERYEVILTETADHLRAFPADELTGK
jgi:hypothetical protein